MSIWKKIKTFLPCSISHCITEVLIPQYYVLLVGENPIVIPRHSEIFHGLFSPSFRLSMSLPLLWLNLMDPCPFLPFSNFFFFFSKIHWKQLYACAKWVSDQALNKQCLARIPSPPSYASFMFTIWFLWNNEFRLFAGDGTRLPAQGEMFDAWKGCLFL